MKTKLKTYTLEEVQDRYIGKKGSPEREKFEFELKMDILSEMVKTARKKRNLTQEELGKLIGVQKAQISKLEKSPRNVTIDTILRVFKALKAKVNFKIEMLNNEIKLA